jgi:hypothetical protein
MYGKVFFSYIFVINEYKKRLKMVVKPIENDKILCVAKFENGQYRIYRIHFHPWHEESDR